MNLVKTEMGKPFYIPYVRPFLRRAPWLASQLPKQIVSQLWAMDRISSLTEIYMTQYLEKLGKAEVDDTVLSRMVNATDPLTGARLDTRELAAEGRSLIIAGSVSIASFPPPHVEIYLSLMPRNRPQSLLRIAAGSSTRNLLFSRNFALNSRL